MRSEKKVNEWGRSGRHLWGVVSMEKLNTEAGERQRNNGEQGNVSPSYRNTLSFFHIFISSTVTVIAS